jgi:hypothetical protein
MNAGRQNAVKVKRKHLPVLCSSLSRLIFVTSAFELTRKYSFSSLLMSFCFPWKYNMQITDLTIIIFIKFALKLIFAKF